MKPPFRTRTKPVRSLTPPPLTNSPQLTVKGNIKWQRAEQRKLLNALKRLSRTIEGNNDIDYACLKKYVKTRSISELQSTVESLMDKVVSSANLKLRKKNSAEKKVAKPIEVWTNMASAIAGEHEESIFSAFSQMLIVSSTEPCTLMNCDPPQVHRPPTDEGKSNDRTITFRPMPRLPVKGELSCSNTTPGAQVPTVVPAKTPLAPSQEVTVSNGSVPHQQQNSTTTGSLATTTLTPQVVKPATSSITPSSSCSAQPSTTLCSSVTNLTQVSSTGALSVASSNVAPSACSSTQPAPPLSNPAMAFHATFGRTSKYATQDSPRTFGLKCVVDFERIYRYLSVVHKPNMDCQLTPMESAIILDLLMCLPEEIGLLDCKEINKHLIQVYHCLSSPADSKIAIDVFKSLKEKLSTSKDGQQHIEEKNLHRNQPEHQGASESSNTQSQSGDGHMIGKCPLLNPFMVPLKLLKRT